MTTTTVEQTLADRLRAAAEFAESHPELTPYDIHCDNDDAVVIRDYSTTSRDDLARVARALGGHWDKVDFGPLFKLRREVADGVIVELTASREDVCERVVTGTREVEIEEPDPAAVEALPKIKRTTLVEDVEWRCAPLLADRTAAA